MKRSKIFLGVTTAILAVVGVAAAKRFVGTVRYYYTSGGQYCRASSAEFCKKATSGNACTTRISGTDFDLYTIGPAGVGDGTKCTNQLLYTQTDN